jgi:hypothetical protein
VLIPQYFTRKSFPFKILAEAARTQSQQVQWNQDFSSMQQKKCERIFPTCDLSATVVFVSSSQLGALVGEKIA